MKKQVKSKTKLKKLYKNSNHGIAAILTLCILLGIVGIGVHATETTIATEENTQELVPLMAQACSYHHYVVNGYYDNDYVKVLLSPHIIMGESLVQILWNILQVEMTVWERFMDVSAHMCD